MMINRRVEGLATPVGFVSTRLIGFLQKRLFTMLLAPARSNRGCHGPAAHTNRTKRYERGRSSWLHSLRLFSLVLHSRVTQMGARCKTREELYAHQRSHEKRRTQND